MLYLLCYYHVRAIARVHSVNVMNRARQQVAANLWTKPTV